MNITEKINELSRRIRLEEEVTDDELREAILSMRSNYDYSPVKKSKKKEVDLGALFEEKPKGRPKKEPIDLNSLFADD